MQPAFQRSVIFLLIGVFLIAASAVAQTGQVKERGEIDGKYQWDLTAMYPSEAAWEADVAAVEAMLPALREYEGKIGQSPEQLLAYFRASEETDKKLENVFVYAHMAYDQDTRVDKYTAMQERVSSLSTQFSEATSWFSPELVSVPDATFEKWYQDAPDLKLYRQYIDDELRTRQHTLSPAEERLLALAGNLARTPGSANVALREADLEFPTIKDAEGNDVEISEARMRSLYESSDPAVRRNAAMALLGTYGKVKNTASALMTGNVSKNMFYSRARGYNSSLHASLDADNIDTTVYLNLIETVRGNVGSLQKYVDLRRRAMKLDTIHSYDMYVPLIPETRMEVPYDKAVATLIEAMTPLGKDYVTAMDNGFHSGWVDVYENAGKRSGAYSWGTYLSHPYLFLNYTDMMDDMFMVAHEMGHAMHTWHSNKYQPYVYAGYTLFVAEVASTFNEALLMDHLLKKEKDPAKRLYLINQYIDNIRGTVITQVMFADFEHRMNRAAEAGEPLTAENLSTLYLETLRDYYGNSMAIEDEYGYTWIRIPHFYRNFYVYKYATSFCASQALSQKVLKKEKGAREKFVNFLSSGSSKYPIDLLKDAGVDLTKPAPVEATMKKFAELVNEMEKLLKQTGRI
ncbi:oligoendopeptidase F [bacterium]|nr:oligoendopeptidase F [bacterium]MBU1983619.1 oligoendopeptidase F [bacterium]